MRQFTDAEKQELEAKIEDQHERQGQAVKEITSKEEEASMSRALSVLSPFRKYRFLGFILCLLAFSVILVLIWQDPSSDQYKYVCLVAPLMLLFNHIAFYFTTSGWQSRVMKTVAWIWIIFGFAYVLWLFGVLVSEMVVAADARLDGHYYVLRSVAGFITP